MNFEAVKNPKFRFCDDLGSPELGIIMDHKWAEENWAEIMACEGVHFFGKIAGGSLFMILKEEDRVYFTLKWT